MLKRFIYLTIFSVVCFQFSFAQQSFRIINQIALEGDGGWDYLSMDNINQHLFVSHGMQVQVIDVATKKQIGVISNTIGVHGITIANDLNKGFISNGKDSSVTIFDLKTLATITKINVSGKNPDAILYDVFSHYVFTFNGKSSNTTVIDAATNKVINTIALDGKPEFAVSDMAGKVYVNIEDKNEIEVINTKEMKVEQKFSISPGNEPSGLAIDIEHHRLFSVCDNKLLIVTDAVNGKVVAQIPIGENVDGVSFDATTKNIFSSNGDGTLSIIHQQNENTYQLVNTLETKKGARTIALNTTTHHLYLPTAEFEKTIEEGSKKHRKIKPNSFTILEIGE
ncbi:MAG: hypothetical protein RJA07_1988 [Bacteroidota bacterium]|jgi:YVTN family beta-propeller protein